jgi:hypothetical protein
MLDAPELSALAELGDRKPFLKLGSRGAEVKTLQQDLDQLESPPGSAGEAVEV